MSFAAYLLKIEHRPYVYDVILKRLGLQSLADRQLPRSS